MENSMLENLTSEISNCPNLKDTVNEFLSSTKLNPVDTDAYAKLGLSLRDNCYHEAAIKIFQKALTIDPESIYVLNYLGSSFDEISWFEEAIETYSKIISLDEKNVDGYVGLARSFRHVSRIDEALRSCQKALKLEPQSIHANICLADIFFIEGNHKEAGKIFEIITSLSDFFQSICSQPDVKPFKKGSQADALLRLENYKVIPDNKAILLYFRLAGRLKKQQVMVKAEEFCSKLIADNPRDFDAYKVLAFLLNMRDDHYKAISLHKIAIELNPKSYLSYNNLGTSYTRLKMHTEAIEIYNVCIAINSKYAYAYYNIGQIMSQQNDFDEAEEYYKKALALQPNQTFFSYSLGLLFKKKQRYRDALSIFQKTSKNESVSRNCYLQMVHIFKLQQDLKSAFYFSKRVVLLDVKPNDYKQERDDISRALYQSEHSVSNLF